MPRAAAIILVIILAALTPVTATARQATPPPGAEAPGPEECRVAPRSPEEIMALFATPAAAPEAAATDVPAAGESRPVASETEFPTGEPADAATEAAVEAVVREFTACINAREIFRVFSLLSDDLARVLASDGGAPTEAEMATAAAVRPTPVSESDRQLILAIRDARVFPDGRVGVVLVGDSLNDEQDPNPSLVVLVQTAQGWLIDAVITVDPEAAGT